MASLTTANLQRHSASNSTTGSVSGGSKRPSSGRRGGSGTPGAASDQGIRSIPGFGGTSVRVAAAAPGSSRAASQTPSRMIMNGRPGATPSVRSVSQCGGGSGGFGTASNCCPSEAPTTASRMALETRLEQLHSEIVEERRQRGEVESKVQRISELVKEALVLNEAAAGPQKGSGPVAKPPRVPDRIDEAFYFGGRR